VKPSYGLLKHQSVFQVDYNIRHFDYQTVEIAATNFDASRAVTVLRGAG